MLKCVSLIEDFLMKEEYYAQYNGLLCKINNSMHTTIMDEIFRVCYEEFDY